MIKKRRLNTQALCCPSHTRSMNFCRSMSATSDKSFEHHGSGEVIVFQNYYIPFLCALPLLLSLILVCESQLMVAWLYGNRKKGGQVRANVWPFLLIGEAWCIEKWRACQFLMAFTVRVRELATAADDWTVDWKHKKQEMAPAHRKIWETVPLLDLYYFAVGCRFPEDAYVCILFV